jgi:hypothetical protein
MRDTVSAFTSPSSWKWIADNGIDKPDELLESDSKIPPGHNPVMGEDSKANK